MTFRAQAVRLSGAAIGVAGLFGCSSSVGGEDTVDRPDIVEVSPESFLGERVEPPEGLPGPVGYRAKAPCRNAPGAMRTYFATLIDRGLRDIATDALLDAGTPAADPITSGPIPCETAVAFDAVPGHTYTAHVRAYDVVVPPGSPAPDPARWEGDCEEVRAEFQQTRRVPNCALVETPPTTPIETGVDVAIASLLGDRSCDTVERLTVRGGEMAVEANACDEFLLVDVTLEAGEAARAVRLEVLAFEAGATTPSLGTVCTARVLAGVRVPAVCDPLASEGAIRVDVSVVLEAICAGAASEACAPALTDLRLEIVDSDVPPRDLPGTPRGTADFPELAPGPYVVRATALTPESAAVDVECSAEVEPGLVARLVCP